ncbi:MAG: TIGR02147 family protein [Bdellovibrionaceae bacterium]|nr:TIGR02147 family protein [Pseudobdellovibrionaceae bacterium]
MTKEIVLFNYQDYRQYLRDYIADLRRLERGIQTKIADALSCQPAYVSKVLAGDAHFSLEQAERASQFCNHSDDEKHFFILLTQYTRAGTPALQKYFAKQLEELRLKNKSLKEHMKLEKVSDFETQLRYYEHWSIAAIHVLLTIPEFRTRSAIATKLNISMNDANAAIDFLKSKNMIQESGGLLSVGHVGLHLGADSPVIKLHHNNWRLKSMDSIARSNPDDLHYSSVVSLSNKDREHFREELLKWIVTFRNGITASKEETLAAIGIDFYSV